MTPFNDLPEGQTHHANDGHNHTPQTTSEGAPIPTGNRAQDLATIMKYVNYPIPQQTSGDWEKNKIESILRESVYGYCCKVCGGGGANGQEKCTPCNGTGIVDWNYALAVKQLTALLASHQEEMVVALKGLEEYAQHTDDCVRSRYSQGRPTKNGYECMYDGKWYESSPVDKTPKCDCGLTQAISLLSKGD